jgi:hypothetical protein
MLHSKGYTTDSFLMHTFNLMLYMATHLKHEMLHLTNISFTDTVKMSRHEIRIICYNKEQKDDATILPSGMGI